jgi:hypothetical protein
VRVARHRQPEVTPDQITQVRIEVLEKQVRDLSVANVRAGVELRAQAAIIRRRNAQIGLLGEGLRRLLLAYSALARIRPAYAPPARVVDTGTPGVDVTR